MSFKVSECEPWRTKTGVLREEFVSFGERFMRLRNT